MEPKKSILSMNAPRTRNDSVRMAKNLGTTEVDVLPPPNVGLVLSVNVVVVVVVLANGSVTLKRASLVMLKVERPPRVKVNHFFLRPFGLRQFACVLWRAQLTSSGLPHCDRV